MRVALRAAPTRLLRNIRHVLSYRFFIDTMLPQNPRFVTATSRDRVEFWRASMELYHADWRAVPLAYFEFGVHRGTTTKWFVSENGNSDSRFYGFDSFEGLPSEWKGGMGQGHFSTDGQTPDIDDKRVTFVPGFFNTSLPPFFRGHVPDDGLIVVVFDADLYGSTVCAMSGILSVFFDRRMVWIFDELLNEELSAFETFVQAYDLKFRTVVTSQDHMRTAVIVEPVTG